MDWIVYNVQQVIIFNITMLQHHNANNVQANTVYSVHLATNVLNANQVTSTTTVHATTVHKRVQHAIM